MAFFFFNYMLFITVCKLTVMKIYIMCKRGSYNFIFSYLYERELLFEGFVLSLQISIIQGKLQFSYVIHGCLCMLCVFLVP